MKLAIRIQGMNRNIAYRIFNKDGEGGFNHSVVSVAIERLADDIIMRECIRIADTRMDYPPCGPYYMLPARPQAWSTQSFIDKIKFLGKICWREIKLWRGK